MWPLDCDNKLLISNINPTDQQECVSGICAEKQKGQWNILKTAVLHFYFNVKRTALSTITAPPVKMFIKALQ